MDKSFEAAKSEVSSEEEWMDLSKSDYAKVIFSNLYWHSDSGDVGCYFALTETVKKNPSDYVGIYKVGYDDLSQCLAMKKLSDIKSEDDSKPIHCGFKSEELPQLQGFYQFLYVTHEKEVCGASMPFEVKLAQKKNPLEEVVTERIENDFLIVRYGLEQKSSKLETLLKVYEAENVVLVAKIKELKGEKALLVQKLEEIQSGIDSVTQEFEQLKNEHLVLVEELKLSKEKEAAVLKVLDMAEKDYIQELTKVREEYSRLLQSKVEAEAKCEKAEADIEKKTQIIEVLESDVNHLRDFYNEMKQQYSDLSKVCDDKNNTVHQLHSEIKKLTEDLASKEKIQKDQWSCDKEEKYKLLEVNFENASSKIIDLEEKNAILKRYLLKPRQYMTDGHVRHSNMMPLTSKEPTADEFLIGQLDDAKFMIKALEDSKQLAMKEMHEISEKFIKAEEELCQLRRENADLKIALEKKSCHTKEELNQLRCENMALKIFLEEKSSCTQLEENKSHSDVKIQPHIENMQMNLLSKLKEIDPTADMNNLERKLMDLITNSMQQAENIDKVKIELNQLRCENMALKVFLEEKPSCSTAGESSQETVSEERENDKYLHEELIADNLKLRDEIIKKDDEIKFLEEKNESQYHTILDAFRDVDDRTARIAQAAELYKDVYKEKEKLAKQLKKLKLGKSRSKKTSVSSAQDNLKPSFLTLNIKKELTCSETTSNNSDSDTGELVRAQILYPDLKKDENYPLESTLPQPVVNQIEETPNSGNNLLGVPRDPYNTIVVNNQVIEVPPIDESSGRQTLIVEEDTYIPCLICTKKFLITPYSNIPMINHLEKVHNINLCPLCGQLFDKSVPSKYLMFHINDHFKSE